jgi:AcrR family transcriptional regulator
LGGAPECNAGQGTGMTQSFADKASQVGAIEASDRVLQILSESAKVFAQKGYDGASMRDIAEACGISKSLLYHHFSSKDEIYARIAIGSTRELYAFVSARIPDAASASDKILAFMVATADYFARYRWAWMASTAAFWNDNERARQKERMIWRDQYEGLLRHLIEQAVENGEFRVLDVPLAGRLILSGLNWMQRWYNPEKPLTPMEIASEFHAMLIRGMVADNAETRPSKPTRKRAARKPR